MFLIKTDEFYNYDTLGRCSGRGMFYIFNISHTIIFFVNSDICISTCIINNNTVSYY
jgi:hypothetical protein